MLYRLLLYIAILLAPGLLVAQSGYLRFNHLDVRRGLSHNQVNCVYKDEKGFLWFGTMAGLNRYDGYRFKVFRHTSDTTTINDNYITDIAPGPEDKIWVNTRAGWNIFDPFREKFVRHTTPFLQSIGLPNTLLTQIKKAKDGSFWFVYPARGLYQYHPSGKKAVRYQPAGSRAGTVNVVALGENKEGNIWVFYEDGVLEYYNIHTKKVERQVSLMNAAMVKQPADCRLFVDAQNDVWLYILNDSQNGLRFYDASKNTVSVISKESPGLRLNNNVINGMIQDDKGLIWVATDHGGVNIIDKNKQSVQYVMNDILDEKSIAHNSIYSIYKDDSGIIWVGTVKKGISYFHQNFIQFPLYKHRPSDNSSLPFDDVNRFVEDAKGNLWIGTNGGGLLYFDRSTGKYTRYLHQPGNPNSLSNNIIVSLYLDREQKLWIGTYFGGLNCFDGKKFVHFKHNSKDSNSLADDRVWEIFEDSKGRLWIGTLASGLEMFDRKKNEFVHYRPFAPNSIRSYYISSIIEDRQGNIWFGTAYGLSVLHTNGKFSHYLSSDQDKASLSNNNVISLLEDSRGFIWIGTRDGLSCLGPDRKSFTRFTTEDGLPDNTILAVLEDDNHNLWLSTPNGLSNLVISKKPSGQTVYQFHNYDENDGLQGKMFNERVATKTLKGELVFGGPNGFNIFYPKNQQPYSDDAPIVLTDLQIFNRSVGIGEKLDGSIVLPGSISELQSLRLKHWQDVFSIEFAALCFQNPEKIKYAYKLEGFNNEWLTTDAGNRRATFTNLDPGVYTFKVKVVHDDGSLSKEEAQLSITILPPFWRTPLAYVMYILLAVTALYVARRMTINRTKARFAIEQERREAQRLHELDMLKIKFFTNISHEFRTPLSLILAPLEKIIKQTPDQEHKKQLTLIQRNAKRLLNLVNLLLDFRKMEVQEFRLHLSEGDIVDFIKDLTYSFSDIAEKKHIHLSFLASDTSFVTRFDKDKLEKIVFNLLSNAFRFTRDGGQVKVDIQIKPSANESQQHLVLKVSDTGIGIPKEDQEKIFERFFQHDMPGNIVNQGSGIGLAITKEFVKLFNGNISVESEPEKGSCFIVSFPVETVAGIQQAKIPLHEEIKINDIEPAEADEAEKSRASKKTTILLVEDNEDFRFYLKDNLKAYFNVCEAADGKEGWKKVLDLHPELVVSDIMMPHMNGLELSKKIKNDPRTSHIPVVLLTAMASEEQQLEGFESGANDYITKPFSFEILLSRIKSLLNQRKLMRKAFQKQLDVNPADITVTPIDEQFLKNALSVVEANISNAEFTVEDFSRAMHMSRVALYKKLVSITGRPPLEFIRSIRLKRAAQLLLKTNKSVAEVAYETGFNNPKYFTRYFKEEFNTLPSQYASVQQMQ